MYRHYALLPPGYTTLVQGHVIAPRVRHGLKGERTGSGEGSDGNLERGLMLHFRQKNTDCEDEKYGKKQ